MAMNKEKYTEMKEKFTRWALEVESDVSILQKYTDGTTTKEREFAQYLRGTLDGLATAASILVGFDEAFSFILRAMDNAYDERRKERENDVAD